MHQRWLLNLALLGFIVILGGLVFYTVEQDKQDELPNLTDLEADQVQTIRIERTETKDAIELSKDTQGFWQVTAPFQLPANSFRIEQLLEILTQRDYKSVNPAELNLAEVKLEPPLISIRFNQLTLALGDTAPIQYGKRYAKINQKVYLLADTIYYSLTEKALAFASLSPLGNNPKITELKIPNYHLTLTEGQWTLTSSTFTPEEVDTSQDALNTLITNWQSTQAFQIDAYDNKPAQGEIEITLEAHEQPWHFILVSTTPELVLARPDKGVQYQLPLSQVERLLHLPTKEPATDSEEAATDSNMPSEDDHPSN